MHIIFTHLNYWQLPLIKLLKFFNFKVFYLFIESKHKFQRIEIATQLKEKNILPLPIEFQKKIPKNFYSIIAEDTYELAYNKNIKMIPNEILKKYCKLFSINKEEVKKLRLIVQDNIAEQQRNLSSRIEIWSNLYPAQKIIFLSFSFLISPSLKIFSLIKFKSAPSSTNSAEEEKDSGFELEFL